MKRLLAAVVAAALALHPGLAAAANIERPAAVPGVSLPGAPVSATTQLPAFPALAAAALAALPVPAAALPAPAIPAAAAAAPQAPHAAPAAAALPRAQAIAAPTHPGAAASDDKTALDARWDAGAAPHEAAPAVPAAQPAAAPAPLSPAHAQRLDAALQGLGRVPAPRVWRGKASAAAAWATLAGAGALAHAPFDRLGPLVVGLVMAPMMSFMWAFVVGTMSNAKRTAGRPSDDDAAAGRWDDWRAKVAPLTEQARLPPPSKLTVRGGAAVQAQAGGSPSDYELVVHGGLDGFPAGQQEAVLRHELGHIRHYDSWSTAAQMFLATIGPMAAVMAGAIADARTWIALPIIAATVPLWYASKRMDEYHADQYAAHAQGSAAPLIRFFVSDAEDREDAVRAAEGLPPAQKPLWRRSWAALKGVVAGHPSHEKRIARLRKLSGN